MLMMEQSGNKGSAKEREWVMTLKSKPAIKAITLVMAFLASPLVTLNSRTIAGSMAGANVALNNIRSEGTPDDKDKEKKCKKLICGTVKFFKAATQKDPGLLVIGDFSFIIAPGYTLPGQHLLKFKEMFCVPDNRNEKDQIIPCEPCNRGSNPSPGKPPGWCDMGEGEGNGKKP
jgi:hypothetical protein